MSCNINNIYVTWSNSLITSTEREKLYGHKSILLWFTGLSGSGKSTIAKLLERSLYKIGIKTFLLDGDNIRKGISSDLDFSNKGRTENIRRIAEIAKLMMEAGLFVISACISPFQTDREKVRHMIQKNRFLEIFVNTPIYLCKKRDPKGLYKKVVNFKIKNFTGIDSAYEIPKNPDIILDGIQSPDCSVQKVLDFLLSKKFIVF
ncbi:adenylyl-sulfate kinase [Buchnera aphidicola]|uniref:adenylyl-sulfate kinase n=1 Tax=Buchnera aphidicola TaxID=9 RepID=UPI003464AA0F